MSVPGKQSIGGSDVSDDAGPEAGDSGHHQERIEEPSVGHIAGAIVAVLLIIAIILVIVSCRRCVDTHILFNYVWVAR